MKKTLKSALCFISAVAMLAGSVVSVSAGELSKEELVQKYAPNGAYSAYDIYTIPLTYATRYNVDGEVVDVEGYMESVMLSLDYDGSMAAYEEFLRILNEKLEEGKIAVHNFSAYRKGSFESNNQWFVNCNYDKGFFYVLREDGTASIVGADQVAFAQSGSTVLVIPEEVGGAKVTKIEDRAFEEAARFLEGITDIVMPDTVEWIGDAAFVYALPYDGHIKISENTKYIGRLAFYAVLPCISDEFGVVKLPESLEFIGKRAFDGSSSAAPEYGVPGQFYRMLGPIMGILDMPESPVFLETDHTNDRPFVFTSQYDEVTYYDWNMKISSFLWEDPKVIAFCEKYDMTRQRYRSEKRFEECLFLYDEANYIDLSNVANYYETGSFEKPEVQEKPMQESENAYMPGDVDGNGELTVADAVLLARYLAQDATVRISDAGLAAADIVSDGVVDYADITKIQRIIAKLE